MKIFVLLFLSITLHAQHWNIGQLTILPEKVSNNAVCEGFIGDTAFVYTFGGIDSTKKYSGIHLRSYRLNTVSNQWQQIASLPDTMGKIAAAASRIKDTIYIIGGYHVFANSNEATSPAVHRYDIKNNQYLTDGTKVPFPTDDQVQCVYKDSLIIVVTGWSNTTNIANVQIYNPYTNTWSAATSVPNTNTYKSFGASGTIIGDTLYYMGGASSGSGFGAQSALRKGYINPNDPTQITWFTVNPNLKVYRGVAITVMNSAYWIGGSEITYNYNGIAYNGSGGVPPSNKSRKYFNGIWNIDNTQNLPMDLRGYARINDTTLVLAGGMEANQTITNKVLKLTLNAAFTALKETLSIKEFTLFPNPATNMFFIDTKENYSATLYDMAGRKIMTFENNKTVDISTLEKGNYLLKIASENWFSQKLISIVE